MVPLRTAGWLCLSFEPHVAPSLAALQGRLGLSVAEMKKGVLRTPAVLGLSFEGNLAPSLAGRAGGFVSGPRFCSPCYQMLRERDVPFVGNEMERLLSGGHRPSYGASQGIPDFRFL